MHQEIVAVTLEIVTDEFEVVAVGDVADALGEERIFGLDLFQADRSLLAGDFGDAGELVDEIARRQPAHREGEFRAQRQAMQHDAEGKADHRGGDRSAENDDDRMFGNEHVNITAEEHHRRNDDDARRQSDTRHNIHGRLQRAGEPPAILGGPRLVLNRVFRPYGGAIKDA